MSNVYLLFPELLLLLFPLLFLFFWRGRARGLNGVVRLLLLLILVLIAAVPLAPVGGEGVDVVVIADLSRSMPEGSRARELEIVKLLEGRRAKGDRVGIVTYGRDARIERLPEELSHAAAFVQEVDPDGSDLGGAICSGGQPDSPRAAGTADRSFRWRSEWLSRGRRGARSCGSRNSYRLSSADSNRSGGSRGRIARSSRHGR